MTFLDLARRTTFSVSVLGLLACFAGAGLANARAPLETQSGTLYLKSSPDADAFEALRVATTMRAQVTGNVARVHVTQKFSNTGSDWVEGLYVFPLAADAAVDELFMNVGDRTIRGEIQEKTKAQATYAQARSEGKQASIVDQERPNMFTTAVANIAPNSTVSIEITYLETIPYRDARYTLRLPLAITPRYTPGAALDPAAPLAAANAAWVNATYGTAATPERVTAPRQNVDITVELAAGFPLGSVASLHHAVNQKDDALGKEIHLSGTQIAADHDFELVWTPAAADLETAAFAEKIGDDTFALVVLTPPNDADEATQAREVTFIIDTSGSMHGPSIEQASAALQMGIDRLKPGDLFNIIRFASDYSSLFAAPQPVDASSRVSAGQFISALRAAGGTEMRAPLERAMSTLPNSAYLQQIVFITDGSVGNEAELIGLISRQIGTARLFTVGIGAAPNSYFLEQAAAAGRGSYTFIAEREQVGSRMQDLFHKLERPALVDLKLTWPGHLAADVAANLPGDIYAGDPLVILARLRAAPSGYLTLSGRIRGQDWVHPVQITPVGEQSGLSKLWARERIADLSRQLQFGGDREALRTSMLELALKHHVVSEFTSLVAVDDAVIRPPGSPGRVEQAPTSAPTGSYWATTGFAKTATSASIWLDCGLLGITLGVFLCRLSSRQKMTV